MRASLFLISLVLGGCSSSMTPSPALSVAQSAHEVPADEVPAMSCEARDINVLEHFIKPTCGVSMLTNLPSREQMAACVARHDVPTVFQIKLLPYQVYVVDSGVAPFYKVFDYPAPWCFGGAF